MLEIVGEIEGETLCAEPERGAVGCAVVKLGEVEAEGTERIVQDGDVLCFVSGAERRRRRDAGVAHGEGEEQSQRHEARRAVTEAYV